MKKLLYGIAALTFTSVVLANSNVPYPTEKVAEFVVEKLDVTTLPSAIRPKLEKAKRTFSDYGYVTRQLDEREAIIETTPSGQQIEIRIIQQEPTGIYVCVAGSEKNANKGHIQRVLLLKLKDVNGLLKSRESSRDFTGCPVIGGADNDSAASSY
jgi:hypothetical protein